MRLGLRLNVLGGECEIDPVQAVEVLVPWGDAKIPGGAHTGVFVEPFLRNAPGRIPRDELKDRAPPLYAFGLSAPRIAETIR